MATAEMRVVCELGVSVAKPGDTLLIGVKESLTSDHAKSLKQQLQAKLPGVEIVLMTHVSHMLVYHPDECRVVDG